MKTIPAFLLFMFSIVLSSFAQPDVQGYIAGPEQGASNRDLIPTCTDGSLFGQSPVSNFNVKSVSNTTALYNGAIYRKYENFDGLTKPVMGITFWGEFIDTKVGSPMPFRIIFYDDQAGLPGNIIASFDLPIRPQAVPGGGFAYKYVFHTSLPSAVDLQKGWISIQGNLSDNSFLWGGTSDNTGDWSIYTKDDGIYTMNPHNLFFCLDSGSLVPISPYAIILGIVLIGLTTLYISRKRYA